MDSKVQEYEKRYFSMIEDYLEKQFIEGNFERIFPDLFFLEPPAGSPKNGCCEAITYEKALDCAGMVFSFYQDLIWSLIERDTEICAPPEIRREIAQKISLGQLKLNMMQHAKRRITDISPLTAVSRPLPFLCMCDAFQYGFLRHCCLEKEDRYKESFSRRGGEKLSDPFYGAFNHTLYMENSWKSQPEKMLSPDFWKELQASPEDFDFSDFFYVSVRDDGKLIASPWYRLGVQVYLQLRRIDDIIEGRGPLDFEQIFADRSGNRQLPTVTPAHENLRKAISKIESVNAPNYVPDWPEGKYADCWTYYLVKSAHASCVQTAWEWKGLR